MNTFLKKTSFFVLFFIAIGLAITFGFILGTDQNQIKSTSTTKKSTSIPLPSPNPWGWTSNCQYKLPLDHPQLWAEESPVLVFCPQLVFIDVPPLTSGSGLLDKQDILVDSTETYPGLFYHPVTGFDQRIPHFSQTWKRNDGLLIKISGHLTTGSWKPRATAVYHLNDAYQLTKIYRLDDTQPGYWYHINIESVDPLIIREQFALKPLSCHGCTIDWVNFYQWEPHGNSLNLVNNQYPNQFRQLVEKYNKQNTTECSNEQTLEELYFHFPDRDQVCGEDASLPTPNREAVETLLKAKIAAQRIRNGENISHAAINDIMLTAAPQTSLPNQSTHSDLGE